jgi:adenine-specific DNA-methyltransferase
VWHFGHGLHSTRRFSGRYETVIWATKGDKYAFDLNSVRVPQKYPGKRSYKGPNRGKISSHPAGKNPEDCWDHPADYWDIPNVKGNHIEKTQHPCQFPVGLVERLILALSKPDALVFDGYAGVASTGVAALMNDRRFLGAELEPAFAESGLARLQQAALGEARYRRHDKELFDHTLSPLSRVERE